MGAVSIGVVEWAVASRTSSWEQELGDGYLVRPLDHGVLLAVVDGVGRGAEAAAATRLALREIDGHAEEPLPEICRRCHVALRESRGVVVSLAAFDAGQSLMTWAGVGGMEGLLVRAAPADPPRLERLVPRSGVVGRHLPVVAPTTLPVERGDLLVLATDGIRSGFERDVRSVTAPPDSLARQILSRHAADEDDALVLIASYRGGPA